MDDDRALNRAWWDERAALHPDTPMYRPWIEALLAGRPVLRPWEVALAGDVAGRDVLHLQCHVGTDTLSWALLGARVTGVDFSPVALEQAAALAGRLGLAADWVHADATAIPHDLDGRFDAVVTTYGTYGWLPDLRGWADGIARALRPGGRFVIVDGHPVLYALDDEAAARGELVLKHPVGGGARVEVVGRGTYADPDAVTHANREVGWAWSLGDVVTALTDAGLLIDRLHDVDACVWQALPTCVRRGEDWTLPPELAGRVPLMFALRAIRPV